MIDYQIFLETSALGKSVFNFRKVPRSAGFMTSAWSAHLSSSIVIFSNIWSLFALEENLLPSWSSSVELSSSYLAFLGSSPSYSSSSASLNNFSMSKLISSSSGLFFGRYERSISMFSESCSSTVRNTFSLRWAHFTPGNCLHTRGHFSTRAQGEPRGGRPGATYTSALSTISALKSNQI